MEEILTLKNAYGTKTIKTNDFRFIIRNKEKILQQKIITYIVNIAGNPIREDSVIWKDIEIVTGE